MPASFFHYLRRFSIIWSSRFLPVKFQIAPIKRCRDSVDAAARHGISFSRDLRDTPPRRHRAEYALRASRFFGSSFLSDLVDISVGRFRAFRHGAAEEAAAFQGRLHAVAVGHRATAYFSCQPALQR